MTGNIAGWRSVLNGIAVVAVAGGMFIGSTVPAFADPTTTTPAPAPTPSTTAAAAPAKPTALPPTGAPAPTVAVAGGAAAGAEAAASAAAATVAAGAAQGDVLDELAEQYAVGSGGGQLSNLLKTSLKLRSMGFKPSKQYLEEIKEAMTHRPNQLPLIGALKDTIAYQQKIAAQMQILQSAQAKGGSGMASGAGSAPGPANVAPQAPQGTGAVPAAAAPPVILPATP